MSQHGAVTAKVECTSRTVPYDGAVSLSFGPDYANGRNTEWAAATPHLSISMTVNEDAGQHFEQGSKYTLTFEPNND